VQCVVVVVDHDACTAHVFAFGEVDGFLGRSGYMLARVPCWCVGGARAGAALVVFLLRDFFLVPGVFVFDFWLPRWLLRRRLRPLGPVLLSKVASGSTVGAAVGVVLMKCFFHVCTVDSLRLPREAVSYGLPYYSSRVKY
jgi:hypothetical protein